MIELQKARLSSEKTVKGAGDVVGGGFPLVPLQILILKRSCLNG